MKKFDVIIIGCGPAGVAAAKTLLKNNVDFCMIDKEKYPRKKLCAGGLTDKSIRVLNELELEYQSVIKQECSSFELKTKNKTRNLEIKKSIVMVDRTEFDNNNLEQIKAKNKNVFEGETVLDIDDNIVITSKDKYAFKYVIFADGVNGYSRKFSNLKNIGFSVEIDVSNRKDTSIAISFDALRDGYAWIFPKGSYSTIGLGKFKNVKDDYKKLLKDFCDNYDITFDEKLVRGYPIPTGGYIKKAVIDNKILVGDAAALVDPISGEGIYYALISGKYAAEAILKKLENDKVNLKREYNANMKKSLLILSYKKFTGRLFYSPLKHFLISLAYSNRLLLRLAVYIVLL